LSRCRQNSAYVEPATFVLDLGDRKTSVAVLEEPVEDDRIENAWISVPGLGGVSIAAESAPVDLDDARVTYSNAIEADELAERAGGEPPSGGAVTEGEMREESLDAGSKAKARQVPVTPGRWCLDLPSGHLIGMARYADLSEYSLPQPTISLAGPPSKSDGLRVQCHVWLFAEPVEASSPMAMRVWRALHPGTQFHGYTEAQGGRVPFHWEITALGPVREKLKDLAVELGVSKPNAAPKPNSRAAIAATLKQHMPELIDRLFAGNDTRAEDKGRIRFGSRGSLSIDPDIGLWYDFEASTGGGPLELIVHVLGCSIDQATAFGLEILEGKTLVEPELLPSPEERRAAAKSELQRAQAEGQAKIAESLQWFATTR
jgi:hypothetical protein